MDPFEGRTLGPYVLEQRLGGGGMASVYRGRHRTLNLPRAIKVMSAGLAAHQGFVRLFYREATLAARLSHPNIVSVYDVAEQEGVTYLVMELLEGRSLRDLIRMDGPLPLSRTVNLVRQLADALDYAHAHGVAHRDVKPANAFVSPDDHLTLVDFGIARAADGTRLTVTHGIGTPEYMAPESFDEELARPNADVLQLGVDADLYALGVVTFELLTGELPFSGRTPQSIGYAHVHRPPPPLRTRRPDLSVELEELVLRQLAKRPVERLGPPNAFADRLAEIANLGDRAVRTEALRPPPGPDSRTRAAAVASPVTPSQGPPGLPLRNGEATVAAPVASTLSAPEPPAAPVSVPSTVPVTAVAWLRSRRASTLALLAFAVLAIAGTLGVQRYNLLAAVWATPAPTAVAVAPAPATTLPPLLAPTVAIVPTPTVALAPPTATAVLLPPTPAPDVLLAQGKGALEKGDFSRAIDVLESLRQTSPVPPGVVDSLYDAHLKYGQALFEKQELDASDQQFQAALVLRPDSPDGQDGRKKIGLARHWAQMEAAWTAAPDTAIAELEAILELDPGYRGGEAKGKLYALLIAKADRLLDLQDRDGALPVLTRALNLDAERGEARARLVSYTPTALPTATPAPERQAPQTAPVQTQPRQQPQSQPQTQPQTQPQQQQPQQQPQTQPQQQQPLRMPGRPV